MSDIDKWHKDIKKRVIAREKLKQRAAKELEKRKLIDAELKRKSDIKKIKSDIENTYDEIVNIYKQYDLELLLTPNIKAALNRSYGTKAGAVVTRRGKLRQKLKELDV